MGQADPGEEKGIPLEIKYHIHSRSKIHTSHFITIP